MGVVEIKKTINLGSFILPNLLPKEGVAQLGVASSWILKVLGSIYG